MSVLEKIAYYQNRRDEVPNQELAKELASKGDIKGIKEIAQNLWNKDKNIQSDCLKVLYETGYIRPNLIAEYYLDFIKLLKSKNNRMVWGAMIALSTIAGIKANEIWPFIDDIIETMEEGSVITIDNAVKTISKIASTSGEYRQKLFPILINCLKTCIPRDVPRHAESIILAVDENNKDEFIDTIESRMAEFKPAQLPRIKKIFIALKM